MSPTASPEFIATYLSSDAGASWRDGAVPRFPSGHAATGDDVTVAFDDHGGGCVCATSNGLVRAADHGLGTYPGLRQRAQRSR